MTPDWIIYGQQIDVSNEWHAVSDPKNERGENCIGYFWDIEGKTVDERHECHTVTDWELRGISIEDECGTVYRDRDWIMGRYPDMIEQVETRA